MKRDLTNYSISKIYIFLGIVSIAGIFLLFFFPRESFVPNEKRSNRDLINQVLYKSTSVLHSAWVGPSQYVSGKDCGLSPRVGEAFLECNPRGWECLWDKQEKLSVEYGGKVYSIKSSGKTKFIRRETQGIFSKSGYITDIEILELDLKQRVFLPKTCHEMFLPQRTYAYGEVSDPRDLGILWDNAGRNIFIDKFYVSEGDVSEWKSYTGEEFVTKTPWKPAKLNIDEQKRYCSFHGKKRLMAHLFDASQMTPVDLNVKFPDMIVRPDTPWQRDYRRSFLGKASDEGLNLSLKDCGFAEVKGCPQTAFKRDSVSWSGVAFGLGFEEEHFYNPFNLDQSLKKSSKALEASSPWHKLGRRTIAEESKEYSFRCFREVL